MGTQRRNEMGEYIEIGGKRYRVAANWNAVRDYCRRKEVTDLRAIGDVLCVGVDGLLTMAHCCIREGERMDGREFPLDETALGEAMGAGEMAAFVEAYARQTTASLPGGGSKKKAER